MIPLSVPLCWSLATALLPLSTFTSPLPNPAPGSSSTLLFLPLNLFPELPTCATYHGLLPSTSTASSMDTQIEERERNQKGVVYFEQGCDIPEVLTRRVGAQVGMIKDFSWFRGRVVYAHESALDPELLAASTGEQPQVGGSGGNEQMTFGLDTGYRGPEVEGVNRQFLLPLEGERGQGKPELLYSFLRTSNSNDPDGFIELNEVQAQVYQLPISRSLHAETDIDDLLSLYTSSPSTAHLEFLTISSLSLPFPSLSSSSSVPPSSISRIVEISSQIRFSPLVSELLATLPRDGFKKDVKYLTGEDQGDVKSDKGWTGRHSMSEGGRKASDWILSAFDTLILEFLMMVN